MSPAAHVTITGTSVSVASTFERKRMRQLSQNEPRPQPLRFTSAMSRKDARRGAKNAPHRRNIVSPLKLSKRRRPSTKLVMQTAPIKACTELLTNHDATIAVGTPLCNSAAKWAGTAASRTTHHERCGRRRNAASRIAFGIQRVETEPGWSANVKPTFVV